VDKNNRPPFNTPRGRNLLYLPLDLLKIYIKINKLNVGKAIWQSIPGIYLIFMGSIQGKYSIHGDIWESYCMSAHRHPTQTIVHWLLIEPNPLKLQFLCQERSRPFWVIFGEKRFKDTMFVIFSMVNLCTNHHVKKHILHPKSHEKI